MSANSQIEWTESTWNPVRGCSKVSDGCKNCYAMSIAYRFSGPGLAYEGLARKVGGRAEWTNIVRSAPDKLDEPLHWKEPRLVFVNSMSDLFHPSIPVEYIAAVFGVMSLACHHTYQILTKRPERMAQVVNALTLDKVLDAAVDVYIPLTRAQSQAINKALPENSPFKRGSTAPLWPLPNVWLGTSCEDQPTYDLRVPFLRQTPAIVRFISFEPLLGRIDPSPPEHRGTNINRDGWLQDIDWAIVGGESGSGARPMHPDWAREIRDRCTNRTDMGRPWPLPFFFKQHGEWCPSSGERGDGVWLDHGKFITNPVHAEWQVGLQQNWQFMRKVGKIAAGRLLDGRLWDEMPAR